VKIGSIEVNKGACEWFSIFKMVTSSACQHQRDSGPFKTIHFNS